MKLVHLRLSRTDPNNLCDKQSILWHNISTYIQNPSWDYTISYAWCPDCIKHPDVIMATLNRSNV